MTVIWISGRGGGTPVGRKPVAKKDEDDEEDDDGKGSDDDFKVCTIFTIWYMLLTLNFIFY